MEKEKKEGRKGREWKEQGQVEKWEGGEGNQVSGNFIHPKNHKHFDRNTQVLPNILRCKTNNGVCFLSVFTLYKRKTKNIPISKDETKKSLMLERVYKEFTYYNLYFLYTSP